MTDPAALPATTVRPSTAAPSWECQVCGYVYDPARGSLRDGVPAGTAFDALAADWCCPDCQMDKSHFLPLEGAPAPVAA